ncbi:unnamed protein product [Lasius platythorax]|uniref:Uncharacterized protein n=1 Tax=Lasius platythorax TaxID=488582 RepID=A0AAV2N4X8_9HYME
MINGGNMPGPLFLSGGHTRASFTLPKVSPEIQEVIEASYYIETPVDTPFRERTEWAEGINEASRQGVRKLPVGCRTANRYIIVGSSDM